MLKVTYKSNQRSGTWALFIRSVISMNAKYSSTVGGFKCNFDEDLAKYPTDTYMHISTSYKCKIVDDTAVVIKKGTTREDKIIAIISEN